MDFIVDNIRLGFATNSSSSHSIIVVPNEDLAKMYDDIPCDYGWQDFSLVSTEEKLRYVAAQVINEALFDTEFAKSVGLDKLRTEMYVDHQSHKSIDTEAELRFRVNLLSHKNIVVVGGNDNSDETVCDTFSRYTPETAINTSGYSKKVRIDGDYIVLFDTTDGTKIRVRLDNGGETNEYTKSTMPELVDLKITNWCDAGCSFCYQSSTLKGKHAPLDAIKKHVDILAEMGVFEIALGGGETTAHPDFGAIIDYIVSKNIVPNFTTYTDKWVQDVELVKNIMWKIGAIGVSVHSMADFETAINIRNIFPSYYQDRKVMIQHVFGSVPISDTANILREAAAQKFPILLLGYKEVGFGKGKERFDFGNVEDDATIMKLLFDQQKVSVSVDTAFVDRHQRLLDMAGIHRVLTTSPEGKFSCYVDAVLNKMGPSSYIPVKEMDSAAETVEDFIKVYAAY
jgi:hypothetical protein